MVKQTKRKPTGAAALGAGPGRPKGSHNKTTAAIKDAIIEAFEKAGGVNYLVQLAEEDPRTFCALVGKVIPLQLEGTGAGGEIIFKTVYESK